MVKSSGGRNVAKARVSNLSEQVLGKGNLQGSFAIFEFVETVFSKEHLEPTIAERHAGLGFWLSPPPSALLIPEPRLLRSPSPSALPTSGPGISWSQYSSNPWAWVFLVSISKQYPNSYFLTKKKVITYSATRDTQHLLSIDI
ncbi:hypothetical protein AMTR_s00042p00220270 [Amborella trichopoda]|uniref:Uncharacterized protein n=1 Tax=Amborella trichopoda TaxID=13333 RepID=W1P7G4_AMBTC|nr:hypothetical protein AMTR_s00042p00220270 [Amborella trichopoda]